MKSPCADVIVNSFIHPKEGAMPEDPNQDQLKDVYKKRGYQQQTFKQYMDMRKQAREHKNKPLPLPVKILLYTPLILLACAGVIFVPYTLFQIFTAPEEPKDDEKKGSWNLQDLQQEDKYSISSIQKV